MKIVKLDRNKINSSVKYPKKINNAFEKGTKSE